MIKAMMHIDFAKAAAHISTENVRQLLMDLVNISSPTGREIGVAQYLVARMRKAGMDTDLPLVDEDRPNAVGHRRGHGDGLNLLFTDLRPWSRPTIATPDITKH